VDQQNLPPSERSIERELLEEIKALRQEGIARQVSDMSLPAEVRSFTGVHEQIGLYFNSVLEIAVRPTHVQLTFRFSKSGTVRSFAIPIQSASPQGVDIIPGDIYGGSRRFESHNNPIA